ncbi:hypothetical protein [Paraburkholderia sp. BR14374]
MSPSKAKHSNRFWISEDIASLERPQLQAVTVNADRNLTHRVAATTATH